MSWSQGPGCTSDYHFFKWYKLPLKVCILLHVLEEVALLALTIVETVFLSHTLAKKVLLNAGYVWILYVVYMHVYWVHRCNGKFDEGFWLSFLALFSATTASTEVPLYVAIVVVEHPEGNLDIAITGLLFAFRVMTCVFPTVYTFGEMFKIHKLIVWSEKQALYRIYNRFGDDLGCASMAGGREEWAIPVLVKVDPNTLWSSTDDDSET